MVAPMTASVALGALAAAAASSCYETSYALQALEARRVPLRPTLQLSLLGRLARRPLWLGAIALAALGWPLQLLALSLAPLTLVQPIIALGVVLLLVLAALILHERIGAREVVGCAGIVLGVAGIAWAAPERSSSHAGPPAVALALGFLGVFVAAPYVAPLFGRRSMNPLWLVVAAGAGDAWAAFGAKLLVDELSGQNWFTALGFALGSATALGAGLLSETSALQRFPAARVGPAVMAMQVAIPVLLAPLVGGEPWGNTPLHGGVLVVSLALVTVSGVSLTRSRTIAGLAEHERGGGGARGVGEIWRSPRREGSPER
jgi:drug/metabolite transporter (DMT)-like permease